MPVTEVTLIPLIPGANIGDPNDSSSAVVNDCFRTLTQQDGYEQMHFGTQVEDPTTLQAFISWRTREDHAAFEASDAYGPFRSRIGTIMSGPPTLIHVDFLSDSSLASVLSAPVTEIFTIYYDGEASEKGLDNITKFLQLVKDNAQGLIDTTCGKTQEMLEVEDAKGKAVVGVIGWQSIQAHMDYREHQSFKDGRPLLAEGTKKIEMHHVVMMNFVP